MEIVIQNPLRAKITVIRFVAKNADCKLVFGISNQNPLRHGITGHNTNPQQRAQSNEKNTYDLQT